MAKSRGAGSKKTANKKATNKAASKKPSALKKTAKTGGAKKATAKKAAKPAAKKSVTKRPAKATTKKAAKVAKPAAKKSASRPAKSTTAAKAAKSTAPKAAKSTAPKAAKTPAAPKATKPAARPQPAEPPPPERPAELELEAVAADTGAPEPETSREAVPRVAPTGPISAHPDAQLTQEQVEELYSRLVTERNRVIAGFDRHLSEALGETEVMPDETDMAQRSTEQAYLIRFADKERKLLSEIEHALEKMRTGEYGVCEGTEEPIGFKRLELRPWTRYSVSYKEQMERERSQHRR